MSSSSSEVDNCSKKDIAVILAKKEKDLELAAKIGQSLLDENHELQNKNEFLEEALQVSNDRIIQLRHELEMRSSLLRVYADYETDLDFNDSYNQSSSSESLQRKMQRLDDENQRMKCESSKIKKIIGELEEKERERITEWEKQIDYTNEKINRLQQSITEKNEEFGLQSVEIERLLKEVMTRRGHEKLLINQNVDLQQQLADALVMHDELATQVIELQESYTEVMSMLHDAEEELRVFRQNQTAYKSGSADSLYDSLASELEASDNGFYNTLNSARSDMATAISSSQRSEFITKLENMKSDVIQNVNPTIEMRSVGVSTSYLSSNRSRNESHSGEDVVDVPTQVLAKLVRCNSRVSQQPHPSFTSCEENNEPPQVSNTCTSSIADSNVHGSKYCDNTVEGKSQLLDTKSQEFRHFGNDLSKLLTQKTSLTGNSLKDTVCDEAFINYDSPKIGEPGRPGTRDLDWSIRRLNIRKRVELEYTRFRRERGLSPISALFFHSSSITGLPYSKFKRLRASAFHGQRTVDELKRMYKVWNIHSGVGLLSAIRETFAQGILIRSSLSFTPPTSVRSENVRFNHSLAILSASSRALFEALNLCLPNTMPISFSMSTVSSQSVKSTSAPNITTYADSSTLKAEPDDVIISTANERFKKFC